MARFLALLILPSLAAGATLHSDQQSTKALVRRQGSSAQFTYGGHDNVLVDQDFNQWVEQQFNLAPENHPLQMDPECDVNYTFGAEKQCNCTDAKNERIMESPKICFGAAKQACPDLSCIEQPDVAPFVLNDTVQFNYHPKGCFKNAAGKWHYNPAGFFPDKTDALFEGWPICEVIVYKNGTTTNSNDCGDDEYELIMDEQECKSASVCLGEKHPDEFRDLNTTMQDKAPKGCHMETEGSLSGWMMFNPVNNLTGDQTPSDPKGQVLCRLKASSQTAALSASHMASGGGR